MCETQEAETSANCIRQRKTPLWYYILAEADSLEGDNALA